MRYRRFIKKVGKLNLYQVTFEYKKFYGYSEQSLHSQVYIAMSIYCLILLVKLITKLKISYLKIHRYLKLLLWKEPTTCIGELESLVVP